MNVMIDITWYLMNANINEAWERNIFLLVTKRIKHFLFIYLEQQNAVRDLKRMYLENHYFLPNMKD